MKKRAHDVVLHELGESIVKGQVSPLENLPSEAELCKKYDVSRNTLREVFRVLTSKGLLEAAPKKGTWVTEKDNWDLFDLDILEWLEGTALHLEIFMDISKARTVIEPEAARLAAQNAKISDLSKIEDAFERMKEASPQSEKACQADVDFHTGLFKASHNHFWMKFGEALTVILKQTFRTNALQERYKDALPLHGEVLEAIRMRNEEKAYSVMKDLTEHSIKTFQTIKDNYLEKELPEHS